MKLLGTDKGGGYKYILSYSLRSLWVFHREKIPSYLIITSCGISLFSLFSFSLSFSLFSPILYFLGILMGAILFLNFASVCPLIVLSLIV